MDRRKSIKALMIGTVGAGVHHGPGTPRTEVSGRQAVLRAAVLELFGPDRQLTLALERGENGEEGKRPAGHRGAKSPAS